MMKLDLQMSAEYTATMSNDSRYTIKLTVTDTGGYDAVNNTSTVNYTLTATKSSGTGYHNEYARSPVIVNINGVDVVNTKVAFDFRGSTPKTITLASGISGAIKHNDDGTKTINVSGTFTDGSSSGSRGTATASGTFTMVTIPRYSVAQTLQVMESEVVILFERYSPYTSVNLYTNNVLVATFDNVSVDEYKMAFLNLNSSQLNAMYNSLKNYTNWFEWGDYMSTPYTPVDDVCKIVVNTYSNSTKETLIGSTTLRGFVKLLIDGLYPTFNNFTYKDTNSTITALTNNNQILLKGYSNAQIEISVDNRATGNKGADITRYTFPDGLSETYSNTSPVTHTLSNYNYGNSIEVKAFDTRGFSTSKSISVAGLISNYTAPVLSNSIVQRKNGLEATTYFGCDLKLWNGNYATDRANEITKFQYRSKISNTETWGEWIDITDKFKTAVTGQSIDNIHLDLSSQFSIHENGTSGGFTTNTEFDIQFAVSDGVGTTIFNTDYETVVLDAGNYLDTYMKSGNGYKYAVNGVVDPNLKNGLQVNGSLYLNGQEINSGGGGKSGDTLPIGSMIPYGKSQPPTNWLVCNGQAVSRTTYADLFAVIGTSYGAGDGSTTFNLPDKRGKVSVGLNGSDTDFDTIGKTGGEKSHTLLKKELPREVGQALIYDVNATEQSSLTDALTTQWSNKYRSGLYNVINEEGGYSHNNLQPYEVDCWIIKAFQSAGVVGNVTNTYSQSTSDTYSCNYINKSAITANINSVGTSLGGNERVPFDSVWSSIGNNFILNNGYIFSKKSCKVEISAQIWTYSETRNWFKLYVGSKNIADVIDKSGADAYTTLTITPVITEITPEVGVSIIGLEATGLNTGANNTMATYITVKEL